MLSYKIHFEKKSLSGIVRKHLLHHDLNDIMSLSSDYETQRSLSIF